MAVFGRLDVFYPDGHIESYTLDGDTVSVGRSEGNTIALDTETISRYHFSITHKDGVVQLTDLDSANGTYIDGTQLKSNDPYLLEDIEEIQIGHLRVIYHPGSDSPTIPVSPLDESTQPTDYGFRVSLEASKLDVWPASSSSVEIAVTNSTDDEKQFQIVVTGLPEGWAKINRPQMLIDGLDTTYALLNIKPSRRADIPPTDYPVLVRVSPVEQPDKFIEMTLFVSLKSFSGLGVALSPEEIDSDDDIQLYMLNQGNEPLSVSISGHDPTHQLQFELPSGDVQLTPGQRSQVTGQVQPQKRPLIGNAVDIPFAVVVKAHTDSAFVAAVPGVVHVEPSLSTWMLGTIGGIVLAIVAVLFVFLSRTPEPQIQSFTVSASQVAQGTPLDLNWTATDAQEFRIEVDRVPVADLPSDQTAYTLDTTDYSDSIAVAVIAVNGDLTAVSQQTVEVYTPAIINSFQVEPLEMMRNVSGALVLSWNISGSVSTNLSIPDGFSKRDAEITYGEADSEVLIGAPQGDFSIVLSAQDEIGGMVEQSVDITVSDPECTPLQDITLHEGPDSQFSFIDNAQPDIPVIVNGVDESKAWVQVELASGDTGWAFLAGFSCEGFDPNQLIVITDVPVLPTEIPTLAPTPTVIPTETPIPSPSPIPTITPTLPPTIIPTEAGG